MQVLGVLGPRRGPGEQWRGQTGLGRAQRGPCACEGVTPRRQDGYPETQDGSPRVQGGSWMSQDGFLRVQDGQWRTLGGGRWTLRGPGASGPGWGHRRPGHLQRRALVHARGHTRRQGLSRGAIGDHSVQIRGALTLRNVHSYTGMAVNDVDQAWLRLGSPAVPAGIW